MRSKIYTSEDFRTWPHYKFHLVQGHLHKIFNLTNEIKSIKNLQIQEQEKHSKRYTLLKLSHSMFDLLQSDSS